MVEMKAVYERPRVTFEAFTAASAVSACYSNMDVEFECLKGPNTDTWSVLCDAIGITNCTRKAGYAAGATTVINYDTQAGASKGDEFSWDVKSDKVTATAKNSILGLLYYCGGSATDSNLTDGSGWHWQNNQANTHTLIHEKSHNCSSNHVQIACVYGTNMNKS